VAVDGGGGDDRRSVVDGGAGPEAKGVLGQAEEVPEAGKAKHSHDIERENRGDGVADISLVRPNNGVCGGDGGSPTYGRTHSNEDVEIPAQAKRAPGPPRRAEGNEESAEQNRQRAFAGRDDLFERQPQTEDDYRPLEHRFGGERQARAQALDGGRDADTMMPATMANTGAPTTGTRPPSTVATAAIAAAAAAPGTAAISRRLPGRRMCSAVGTVDALATVAEPRPGSSTRVISLSLGDGRAARNRDCTDHVLRFAYTCPCSPRRFRGFSSQTRQWQ